MFFVLEDFAAEKLAAFKTPGDVSWIPESVGCPLAIEMKIEGLHRASKSADHMNAFGEMEINTGDHPIVFIDPDAAGSFVDESIFEAVGRKLFVRRFELNDDCIASITYFPFHY